MDVHEGVSSVQKLIDTVITFCVNYSFQVVGAIIVLILGVVVGNWLSGVVTKLLAKKDTDVTLTKFLAATVRLIVLGFALIIALGKFGISTSPLIAALSAVAFGASFALKGPLSNYGAGISIILSRPFVVGQTITVRDVSGVVDDIKLACTKLKNEDGVTITIPNNQIVGEILYNSKQNKVVENKVGISYDSDPDKAIAVISSVIAKFSEVVQSPAPQVGIEGFGDSSINIGCRYWVPTVKYFQISYAVNLAIFKALKEAKIVMPFPQREIRVLNESAIKV